MLQKVQQNKWLRLGMGVLGGILMAAGINLIVVPQGMYSGGLYGLCQVIRTLLVTRAGLSLPFDLAGLLYLLVNLPMFYLAYRGLGRTFFVKATIVTVCNSVFSALIPSPATPIRQHQPVIPPKRVASRRCRSPLDPACRIWHTGTTGMMPERNRQEDMNENPGLSGPCLPPACDAHPRRPGTGTAAGAARPGGQRCRQREREPLFAPQRL